MECARCISSNEQKREQSSPSTKKELLAQEKKKLICRHNRWEANKNVRATQAVPNNAGTWTLGLGDACLKLAGPTCGIFEHFLRPN